MHSHLYSLSLVQCCFLCLAYFSVIQKMFPHDEMFLENIKWDHSELAQHYIKLYNYIHILSRTHTETHMHIYSFKKPRVNHCILSYNTQTTYIFIGAFWFICVQIYHEMRILNPLYHLLLYKSFLQLASSISKEMVAINS